MKGKEFEMGLHSWVTEETGNHSAITRDTQTRALHSLSPTTC